MQRTATHFPARLAVAALVIISLLGLQGCKKSGGGGGVTPSSTYYMSADINGKAWDANVYFSTYQSYAIGALFNASGSSYMFAVGLYASNGDTSAAIAIVFPVNITLNVLTALDSTKSLDVVYTQEDPLGSGVFDGYNTAAPTGGSGTITITNFDQTNHIIEGTFSGIWGSDTNSKTPLKFNNGKFRCPYESDISELPAAATKF